VILAYDGVQLLDLTGPVEVFQAAAERGAAYEVVIASAGGEDVVTSAGTRIGADRAFGELPRSIDTLVVPGAVTAPEQSADTAVVSFVAGAAGRSRRVASVCAGAFLLAAAGLLDGRRATTHWELAADLARNYPRVSVDADAIFVDADPVFTSAGITAGIDLCLALVEADCGAVLARAVARHLVVFMQRPGGQTQFSVRLERAATDATVRRVLDAVVADPAGDHCVDALGELAGFSVRHLARVFRREVGTTPARYVERVRVEAARARLEEGRESLDGVARAAGFGSAETMRRAFARELGTTPGDYRRRFGTTGPSGRAGG
jgi:transcriptional regulator GlxA family with amidase domain